MAENIDKLWYSREQNPEKYHFIYYRHPNENRGSYKSKIPFDIPPSYSTFITKTTRKSVLNCEGDLKYKKSDEKAKFATMGKIKGQDR